MAQFTPACACAMEGVFERGIDENSNQVAAVFMSGQRLCLACRVHSVPLDGRWAKRNRREWMQLRPET